MNKSVLEKNIDFLANKIEHEFDTKVLKHGIIEKSESIFKDLIPWGLNTENVLYMVFFYVPTDEEDNIITNDYYEKSEAASDVNMCLPTGGYNMPRSHTCWLAPFAHLLAR
jgi:hypothetical protein